MAETSPFYTLAEGQPRHKDDTTEQLRTGRGGGFLLMTSTQLIENLAHFSRERVPERSVHAKAAGARGYFEVTEDIFDITDADFLTGIGKQRMCLFESPPQGLRKVLQTQCEIFVVSPSNLKAPKVTKTGSSIIR